MPGFFHITKHPNEEYPIGLEYESPDLESGETLVSGEVTITPSGITDDLVTKGGIAIGADTVKQLVEKGRDGIKYTVLFKVVSSIGYIYYDKIIVDVEE